MDTGIHILREMASCRLNAENVLADKLLEIDQMAEDELVRYNAYYSESDIECDTGVI